MDLLTRSTSISLIINKVEIYFSLVEITVSFILKSSLFHLKVYISNYGSQMYTRARETRPALVISLNQEKRHHCTSSRRASTKMINILELYDLIACRYLNCYRVYLDILNNSNTLELRDTLLHRMHIYYDLEIIYNSIDE